MPGRILSDLLRTMQSFFRTEGGFEGKQIAKPSNPATGYRRVYPKTDGWYDLDSSGTETKIGSGSAGNYEYEITAGEALAEFDVVYLKASDGKWYKGTNAGTDAQADVQLIVTESGGIASNGTGTALRLGRVTNNSWSLTDGLPIFLGTGGAITQTEPTTEGTYWIPLGSAEGAHLIFFLVGTGYKIGPTVSGGTWYYPITLTIDGKGSVISTGAKSWYVVPATGTITSWFICADQSGSISLDIWKDVQANHPPTVADSICGSNYPALTSAIYNSSTSFTSWTTTTVTAGDVIRFAVNSASTVTKVTLTLVVRGS